MGKSTALGGTPLYTEDLQLLPMLEGSLMHSGAIAFHTAHKQYFYHYKGRKSSKRTLAVVENSIKVLDVAQAVTAQRQAVRAEAQALNSAHSITAGSQTHT